jgi:Coenzyme PQQ synthesis protein D (PqqD)
MTNTPGEKLQIKAEDVVWREVGEELVVLELSTSTYLTLNGTAKHLWESLADGATLDGLIESLADHYRITEDQARADVEAFVAALTDRGLLLSDN